MDDEEPEPRPPRRPVGPVGRAVRWGCLAVGAVLAFPVALMLMLAASNAVPTPTPDGDPLDLTEGELVGAWADDVGSHLTLAPDGTFQIFGACGDFSGTDVEPFSRGETIRSGTGDWRMRESPHELTVVQLDFAGGTGFASYTVWGTREAPVLWTYLGPPDAGDLCVLHGAVEE
ncbi:hypothetical protein [Streptomyces mayteni]